LVRWLLLGWSLFVGGWVYAAEPVKVAVLAFRPKPQTLMQWQPLAAALKAAIPERDFVVQAYTLPELQEVVASRQVDFVLTNPGHYVLLTRLAGLKAPLATMVFNESGQEVSAFGGVIFTRADRPDLATLADVKGHSIAAVSRESLGGYQMQALELLQAGVTLAPDAKLLFTGVPQDQVVAAVLQQRADVGFVRTGLLEAMQREGKLDLSQVRVLNTQKLSAFPVQSSTPLYPEWPVSYLGHVDERLARRVVAALFSLRPDDPAVRAMGIRGFSVPADYTPVADLLRTLRMPPFDMAPIFTWRDVVSRYQTPLLGASLGLILIFLLSVRLWLAQRRLRAEVLIRQASERATEQSRELLLTVIDNVPVRIFWKDRNLHYLGCNTLFAHDAGRASPADVLGKSDLDLNQPEHAQNYRQDDRAVIDSGQPKLFYEEQQTNPQGQPLWLRTSKVPLRDANGAVVGVLGLYEDVTERRHSDDQLRLAASVFEYAREGICITDVRGDIIDVNRSFSQITGFERDEVLGKNPRFLSSGRHDAAFYTAMFGDLQTKGHWVGEIWNRRKSGEIFVEMLTISAVKDTRGALSHYVAMFFDITDIKEHQRQLEHIAHFDALTGLPNRVLLADRLHQAMIQAQRRGQRLAVAYLDLDGFKLVNDTYGHEAGDRLLITVADNMKHALRECDTLARLGGDEFVAVLADLTEADDCSNTLTRLLNAASQPLLMQQGRLEVSASLGVTFYPQADPVDADQLMRQADQAMYQAKLAGKNRYHLFDTVHDRSLRGLHESLDAIATAMDRSEFVLYYQPKVNLRLGQVVGVEALVRWRHPAKGLLPPAQFLPVIEDHPMAVSLGEWVISTALNQMQLWQTQGLEMPVSVNVGARQLQQDDFVQRLCDMLALVPSVSPTLLQMEVLETSALQDLDRTAQVIRACEELGVSFAMDDFGTGYSSLTYLKHLPVHTIKIDRSFVRDMLDDPDDLAILDGVVSLARAFQREVIAEGMETAAHGTRLLQLGCELAQGYGIAHPMPAADFPGWLAGWQPDPAWARVAVTNLP